MTTNYYDDELILKLLKDTNLGDIEIKNNYFEAMDIHVNDKNNKYYIRGLNNHGMSSYVPSIYKFKNGEQLVVSISQIYDIEQTDKIHAWNIIIESVTNLKSEFTKFRFFLKYDEITERINCNYSEIFNNVINYLKFHIPTYDVHVQIIIDFI